VSTYVLATHWSLTGRSGSGTRPIRWPADNNNLQLLLESSNTSDSGPRREYRCVPHGGHVDGRTDWRYDGDQSATAAAAASGLGHSRRTSPSIAFLSCDSHQHHNDDADDAVGAFSASRCRFFAHTRAPGNGPFKLHTSILHWHQFFVAISPAAGNLPPGCEPLPRVPALVRRSARRRRQVIGPAVSPLYGGQVTPLLSRHRQTWSIGRRLTVPSLARLSSSASREHAQTLQQPCKRCFQIFVRVAEITFRHSAG